MQQLDLILLLSLFIENLFNASNTRETEIKELRNGLAVCEAAVATPPCGNQRRPQPKPKSRALMQSPVPLHQRPATCGSFYLFGFWITFVLGRCEPLKSISLPIIEGDDFL